MSGLTEAKKKQVMLLMIPGTGFWILIGAGLVTKNTVFFSIAVPLILLTFLVFGVRAAKISSAAKAERARVWENGQPAKAIVRNISTTGGGMNDNPQIEFELEVHLDGEAPYPVKLSALVSKLAIPRIQPDSEIEVRVDRNNKKNIVLDEKLTPYGHK